MNNARLAFAALLAPLVLAATAAQALPVQWVLTDVEFDDGATATGSFIYDALADSFSAVSVATAGGVLPDTAYAAVLFGGAWDALLVADPLADLTGETALQLVFQQPLTAAGGFVDLTAVNPFFSSFELVCFDGDCIAADIARTMVAGGLVGTVIPVPAAWLFMASGLGVFAALRRWRRRVQQVVRR
jgi:hypothetical protein